MVDTLVAESMQIIRRGSKSFHLATRLFDPAIRDDAVLLYAWCRHCDDLIDGQYLGHGPIGRDQAQAQAALAQLHRQTQAAFQTAPVADPVFAGLQRIIARHAIPAEYPLALLEGFAMDVAGRRYETLSDTLEYCYHVAGVVGVMMAWIMGLREPALLRRAADLGIAFQLTNIARDVYADAQGRRLYLPQIWVREAGIPASEVTNARYRTQLFGVIQRLVATAEPFYASGGAGLRGLSFRSAWAVAAARDIYRAIGREVVKRGPSGFEERTVVPRAQRSLRLLRSGFAAVAAVSLARIRASPPRDPSLWAKW